MIKAVFLDVANTLLHKKNLFSAYSKILESHGYAIAQQALSERHKLISEVIEFPDLTNEAFYRYFNTQLLFSFGIIPTGKLLDKIYEVTRVLPWAAFEDSFALKDFKLPLGILSNWDHSLPEKIQAHLDIPFKWMLGSASAGVRKPDTLFFQKIPQITGFAAEEIIYVGDSIKLDIQPALKIGMKAILIDRPNVYACSPLARIQTLQQISEYV